MDSYVITGGESQKLEDALIQRALDGDDSAFEELVITHSPALFKTVSRFAADRSEAEAIVQDTWLRAWRALPRYKMGRPFLPWLLRIAVNRSRDIWRKKKDDLFSDLNLEEDWFANDEPLVEARVIRAEQLKSLAEGVAALRVDYRMAIALRYDGGLSYKEVADAMDIPLNTVRTYLRRAKQSLLQWMEENNAG